MALDLGFDLTDETRVVDGKTLRRVKYADSRLGGFVESTGNLDGGLVLEDACVLNGSIVRGHAIVRGSAVVTNRSILDDDALVKDRARVHSSWILDFTVVSGDAYVRRSVLQNRVRVNGRARLVNTSACGLVHVRDDARVVDAFLLDSAVVDADADVRGTGLIGHAAVSTGAKITDHRDVLVLRNNWSSGRVFTAYRTADGGVRWCVGCFCGTSAELVAKAAGDSKLSGEYYAAAAEYAERVFRALDKSRGRRTDKDKDKNENEDKKGN